jgi:hypothetical protein
MWRQLELLQSFLITTRSLSLRISLSPSPPFHSFRPSPQSSYCVKWHPQHENTILSTSADCESTFAFPPSHLSSLFLPRHRCGDHTRYDSTGRSSLCLQRECGNRLFPLNQNQSPHKIIGSRRKKAASTSSEPASTVT